MSSNHHNTALLVMDMQTAMLKTLPNSAAVIAKTKEVIEKARSKGIAVIYVVVGFREGAPEIADSNKGFTASKQMFANLSPADFMAIHPDLAPSAKECVVTKRRVSAFTGSDLEVLLRAQRIHHIVLTGIATSGVVLSTTREAADKDYHITILADACADREEEVHQFLTTKILPRQAEVIRAEEWLK